MLVALPNGHKAALLADALAAKITTLPAAAYRINAERLGRSFVSDAGAVRMNRASTDMGNVSQVVPAIRPYIGINSLPALSHQPEFAAHCVGEDAEQALTDAATALAWTALDVAEHRQGWPR